MTSHRFLAAFAMAVLMAVSAPAGAVEPDEILPDAAQEARARALSQHLRCVVCQNQAVDDSNAEVAHDMRRAVRERLAAGDSDDAVFAFMVARYGNFVLLKPPLELHTLLLWFGPGIVLLLALTGYWTLIRKPATADTGRAESLSAAEREELEAILKKGRTS